MLFCYNCYEKIRRPVRHSWLNTCLYHPSSQSEFRMPFRRHPIMILLRDLRLPPRRGCERAVLGYYAASNGNSLPTFRDNLSVPSSVIKILTLEDGTDILSRKRRQGITTVTCVIIEKSVVLNDSLVLFIFVISVKSC